MKIIRFLLKLGKFSISGGLGAIVGFAVLYFLTEYVGIWYIYSSVIAFIPSCMVSFILKKFWTFEDKSIEKIENQSLWYLLLAIIYLIVNTILLYWAVDILHREYISSQAILIFVLLGPDFLVTRKIFPKQKTL